jgi:cobalt transporter subunit CbtB
MPMPLNRRLCQGLGRRQNHQSREPGDLPIGPETVKTVLTGNPPGANTEVVMLASKSQSTAQSQTVNLSLSLRLATAAFAGLFGVMLLYAVAFANSDILHNAAHDTRHAIVVPCH